MSDAKVLRIALLGEFNPSAETHIATEAALAHSSLILGRKAVGEWISSKSATKEHLADYDGLWVTPGPPHFAIENSLKVIRHARESGMPTFGNCGGFQLLAIEIARNLLGMLDAHHEEYSPTASLQAVTALSCSLRGQELPINIVLSSLVGRLYKEQRIIERYYCRFGINPAIRSQFTAGPVAVSACDEEGEIRAFEVPQHPFFLATLFVPQAQSSVEHPHPLVTGFLESCLPN